MKACLAKDPAQRQTAAELLRHPFIVGHEDDGFDLADWLRENIPVEGAGADAGGAAAEKK